MNRMVNPEGLAAPVGFSYASVSSPGSLAHLAGITGHRPDGTLADDLVSQFDDACQTVAIVLREVGASPHDVVSMTIYTTDIEEYRGELRRIGEAWRTVFGKHYPPMALIGVSELFDPMARVELVCVAVIPD